MSIRTSLPFEHGVIEIYRTPTEDTNSHTSFGYRLTVYNPAGNGIDRTLFGRQQHVVGIANFRVSGYFPVLMAAQAAAMKLGETDKDWFEDYTVDEMLWAESPWCDEFGAMIIDMLMELEHVVPS